MEFKKNQTVELTIEDFSENGEGIGKIDGYTLFVKDAILGDRIEALITKAKKNYGFARLMKIIESSPYRIDPPCKISKSCGGCQIQALSYKEQLEYKKRKVKSDLVRIGGFDRSFIEEIFEGIEGMEEPYRYRNKTQLPVGRDKKGKIISGFYAKRTHDIIECQNCVIGPKENKIASDIILKHMIKYGIEPYDEKSGRGKIRHVLLRKAFETGEISICIVTKNEEIKSEVYKKNQPEKHKKITEEINAESGEETKDFIPHEAELIKELKKIEGVKSIVVNINNDATNVILGRENHVIWGSEVIRDVLLKKTYEISPMAFYQVNPLQTKVLYESAIEFAAPKKEEEAWDICCGIGTIALSLSDRVKKVHGLEIVEEAIEDAKRNAKINKVENADFICAPAEEYLPAHKDEIRADVIVMDPPRKGMDERALEAVVTIGPEKIVYVSCDPATLSRDLKYLCERGYILKRVKAVDMFPHTTHVEVVSLLQKMSNTRERTITLDVEMEDYYRLKNETEKA